MPSKIWRIASALIQAAAVAVACWQVSPLDPRTIVSASSEYIRNTGFGPYDRLVYAHVQRRPFEVCAGTEERHSEVLDKIAAAVPDIEASTSNPLVRLTRVVRTFNRETQTFYATPCPGEWTYFYTYVDYQSGLMKVAGSIWVVDALHRSEIYIILALIAGSWLGVASLFWLSSRVAGTPIAGFASLVALWYSLQFFGPGLHADFRLNLLTSFSLPAIGYYLCSLPTIAAWRRRWAIELIAAGTFGVVAMLLTFPRTPSTRLDAVAVLGCIVIVGVLRRNWDVLRRALLVFAMMTIISLPYNSYTAELLKPVGPVNTAAAEEFKIVNAVNFLTERPTHFGNFVLDFNFTWIFDADYYLVQLSPVPAFHHGYPAWGRKYLKEMLLEYPFELVNSWWRRFAVQVVYHRDLSYGIYRTFEPIGHALMWLGTVVMFLVVLRGPRLMAVWPVLGLIFWEVYGLHTFLGLMHVHAVYLMKGVPLLWSLLPCLVILTARELFALWKTPPRLAWPAAWSQRRRQLAVVAIAVLIPVTAWWAGRHYLTEVHAMRMWRAVHAGQYFANAYLSPEQMAEELDAIRALGTDDPGNVSMFGAWAFFGYLERLGAYNTLMNETIQPERVRQLLVQQFERAMQESPDNPHFYPYARYFALPDRLAIFREGLRRFPEHAYGTMMNYFVAVEDPTLQLDERIRYFANYDNSIRRQLREYPQYRPTLVEEPDVDAHGPPVKTADGLYITLLPGETAKIGRFRTYGTDRMALGVYLKVTQGSLLPPTLEGQPGARLIERGPLTTGDPTGYRAWHFQNLSGDRLSAQQMETSLQVQAGPEGARLIVRDLYPLVENPRWFR